MNLLERIANWLTHHTKTVLTFAVILLLLCFVGAAATRINYDILTYLPEDLDSSKGEKLLEEPFSMAATTMLIIEDMPAEYASSLCNEIAEVPGVSNALSLSSIVGAQIPTDFLPESLRDVFYSGDSTMIIVMYDEAGASESTMQAIEDIRALCNEKCFLAGFSVVIKDTRELVDQELPTFILLAVVLSFIVMAVTMESWVLPAVFLASIGFAVMYNMGTNIFLGEISYITKAIAAVLQLGVTMDYSIFLYSRYEEERQTHEDNREAMALAIKEAFVSLSSSSLTTIAGFLALCFMRFTLGLDIGIVMAKGVVLGVATVIFVLPAMLLQFDGLIRRFRHKAFVPNLSGLNRFVVKHCKVFLLVFLILFVPAVYSQTHASVYYKLDESLPQDMPSIIANKKLKEEFNMATSHFIIMRDDLPHSEMTEMLDRMKAVDGVESVIAYDEIVPEGIPSFFLPEDLTSIIKQDNMQIVMLNSKYETASDAVSAQIDELEAIMKEYDPDAYITGEAVLTADLVETTDVDFKTTNYLSIAAILLIVALTFRSVSIPVILVAAIELAIFINEGVPYFTGTSIPFVAPTIIGCVQLGATVDYAILMTTRFREELQNGHDRHEAILIAADSSSASIITSSMVLFFATLGVGCVSKIEMIGSICIMLARGAIISALCILLLLPALLYLTEPIIAKTSRYWRNAKVKKQKALNAAPANN